MAKKLAFITGGTKGDVFPFIGIAREFKRRGHQIVFIGSDLHREFAEAEGFEFEAIFSRAQHERLLANPDIWKPIKGMKLYVEHAVLGTAMATFETIQRHAFKDDLALISNNLCIGALLAHEKLKIPMASLFLHPYSRASLVDPPKDVPAYNLALKLAGPVGRRLIMHTVNHYLNSFFRPVNQLRRELDLPPISDVLGAWRHSVPLLLDLWPEWYSPGPADRPPQALRTGFVTYDGPIRDTHGWQQRLGLVDFLNTKPIVFTMGSEMKQNFEQQLQLFRACCDLLKLTGLFVTTGVPGHEALQSLGEKFKVVRFAPFSELFPLASAVVCHGGVGTVARIMSAGRPAVITPLAYDQFDNGNRLRRLALGETKPYHSLNPAKLAALLTQVLNVPSYAQNAQIVALRMRSEDGLTTTCNAIAENLLARPLRMAV